MTSEPGKRRPTVRVGGLEVEPVARECLDFLYDGLREARRRFETGDGAGRDGAMHALETVSLFLLVLEPVRAEALLLPLVQLVDALRALDNNNVMPLLTPKRRSGRPLASEGYAALKANAVFTTERLLATGMIPREARKMVAETLTREDVRPARRGSGEGTGYITERTIRKWQGDIAADVGCHTTAAQMLRLKERGHLQEFLGTVPTGGLPALYMPAKNHGVILEAQTIVDRALCSLPAAKLTAIRADYLDSLARIVRHTRAAETT